MFVRSSFGFEVTCSFFLISGLTFQESTCNADDPTELAPQIWKGVLAYVIADLRARFVCLFMFYGI